MRAVRTALPGAARRLGYVLFASDAIPAPAGGSRVRWAFTDALGPGDDRAGDRPGPASHPGPSGYGGFNLAAHVGDDPQAVAGNRAALAARLGVGQVVYMNQVHGSEVAEVSGPWPPGEIPPCDAVVTTRRGLALAVLVADCVPVLLADPQAGIVGAAHAGRAGMMLGVVPAAVNRMRALGARAIQAVVGPSICGRCYEVPAKMRAQVAQAEPLAATVTWTGTPGVDVAAAVVRQLSALDVPITWVAGCTREEARLYSYRRDPQAGRFAGVVVAGPGEDR